MDKTILLDLNKTIQNLCIKINFHSKRKSNQIVLLRLDALGDFIIWQDAAKEFKKKYPNIKISVICQGSIAEFAKTLPYFDEVYGINIQKVQQSLRYFLNVFFKMYKFRGSILIQTVYSRNWIMNVIVAIILAYKKITVDGNYDNIVNKKEYCDHIYDSIKYTSQDWDFELRKNAMFMRCLGFRNFYSNLPRLPEYSLGNKKIQTEYFVIVLGTSIDAKDWKPAYFGIVAKYIYDKYQLQCCLLGIKQDKSLCNHFLTTYGLKNPYIELFGKTSIMEYVQLIREAKIVISGDTSAAHIAAAVRTKSIVITGGWHYGRFFPYDTETGEEKEYFPQLCYQCNRKYVTNQCKCDERRTGKWSCILAVTPEMVIEKVDMILSNRGD